MMLEQFVKLSNKVKGHRSEVSDDVCQIQALMVWNGKFISIGLDCKANIWTNNLQHLDSLIIFGDYVKCICYDPQYILFGNGSGQLLFYNPGLKLQKRIKIATDTLSDILITQTSYIIVSYDGSLIALDRNTKTIQKKIDLQMPLTKICEFQGSFYISGVRSWKVSKDFLSVEQIQRSTQFIVFKNELIAISPTKGFYSYTRQIYSYEPCDLIFVMDDKIIGLFDEGMTIFSIQDDQITTKSKLMHQFGSGSSPKAICRVGQREIAVGCEDGSISKLIILQ